MQYLFAFSFLILCFQNIVAQQTITVNWSSEKEESAIVEGVSSIYVANASNFLNESGVYMASFQVDGYSGFSGDLEVFNVKYGEVSKTLFGAAGQIDLAKSSQVLSSTGKSRDQYVHRVTITPVVCNGNGCKRLLSFQIKKSLKANKSFAAVGAKALSLNKRNSILASGEWKRIAIDTTGIFQIDSNLLTRLGYNTSNIDPNNVRVFGFGGKSLPLANEDNLYFDPPEVAVDVVGGGDGNFGPNDKVYFYGVGIKGWNEDNKSFINPYSDVAYYYINVSSGIQNKRVANLVEPAQDEIIVFNSFNYETFFEEDHRNLTAQGREWFGSDIDVQLNRKYRFFIPERSEGKTIGYRIRMAGDFSIRPSVVVGIDGDKVQNINLNLNTRAPYSVNESSLGVGQSGSFEALTNQAQENVELAMDINNNGDPSMVLNLDYIALNAECKLKGFDKQFVFSNNNQGILSGVGRFVIENAESISSVWDVSDQYNVARKNNVEGGRFSFKAQLGQVKKYLAFDPSDVYFPRIPSEFDVVNQDIKGTVFNGEQGKQEKIDYLLITDSSMLPAAQRLATYRQSRGLNVRILTTQAIYNEFSCGQQDISAIRNAIRYVYQNASSESERVRYVCVLGSPSYDYKDRIEGNTNVVPTYHVISGASDSDSFSSDDYFTFMDEEEGGDMGNDVMDIAIGRMLARNNSEANLVVDKTINYSGQNARGAWKRNITFIGDDPDNEINPATGTIAKPSDAKLQVMLDFSADLLSENIKRARVNKLLADAFQQVTTSGGARYPELEKAMVNSFETGSILTFYLGHGGTSSLADEQIFTSKNASELTNVDRPNIFVTVTCELTRLDNPAVLSAGEILYLNSRGGSLGLITTVRNIFVSVALRFYPIFVENLFDDQGQAISIGEALRLSKIEESSKNKRTIFCIGDPALVPSLPKEGLGITGVNEESNFFDVQIDEDDNLFRVIDNNGTTATIDREGEIIVRDKNGVIDEEKTRNTKEFDYGKSQILQGLSKVVFEGNIFASENSVDTKFDGVATVNVFGIDRVRETFANDGHKMKWEIDPETKNFDPISGTPTTEGYKMPFKIPGKLLFSGKSSIKEGKFQTTFIMPKNIDENIWKGLVSVYAEKTGSAEERLDVNNVLIGGFDQNAPEDNVPPQIEILFNDEFFKEGQLVGADPLLIVKLADDSGINTAGGIGHDLIAIIDGDEANPLILNEFYSSVLDDFTQGKIEYRLLGLEEGEHTIEVRVSDSYNNVASKTIVFNSATSTDFNIKNVLNYPNPFTSKTGFWFGHTGVSSLELDVFIQVFTVTGKIVKTLKTVAPVSGKTLYENVLMWDGKDDFGKKIGKGTYLYKISVKSPLLNKTITKIEKLVVL